MRKLRIINEKINLSIRSQIFHQFQISLGFFIGLSAINYNHSLHGGGKETIALANSSNNTLPVAAPLMRNKQMPEPNWLGMVETYICRNLCHGFLM